MSSPRILRMAAVLALVLAYAGTAQGISDPGWGQEVLLEIEPGLAFAADIAADAQGSAIAVWLQEYGPVRRVFANRYVTGIGWGSAEVLSREDTQSGGPLVEMGAMGNAIALWSQSDGLYWSLFANRYEPGKGWGLPQLVEASQADILVYSLGANANGIAFAGWHQWEGNHTDAWANRYVPGQGWGTAQLIEMDDLNWAVAPRIAVDPLGNAIAVWRQGTPVPSIWANRYVDGLGWGTPTLLETSPRDAEFEDVAADGAGNAIAIWHQNSTVWASRYVEGAGWGSPARIGSGNPSFALSDGPHIAVNPIGNATVVWSHYLGREAPLFANRYSVGQGWGSEQRIDLDIEVFSTLPDVAMDATGNAMVVWAPTVDVYSNRYEVEGGWKGPELVETRSEPGQHPRLALDGAGNAFAVWRVGDGTRINVWANRYVVPDSTPPILTLTSPTDGVRTGFPTVTVSGTTEPGAQVTINGLAVSVASNGSFSVPVALLEGANVITAVATDAAGNQATATVSVTYENPVPGLLQDLRDALNSLDALSGELTTWRIITLVGLAAVAAAFALTEVVRRRRERRDSRSPPSSQDGNVKGNDRQP